jgi:hypothetical protein
VYDLENKIANTARLCKLTAAVCYFKIKKFLNPSYKNAEYKTKMCW